MNLSSGNLWMCVCVFVARLNSYVCVSSVRTYMCFSFRFLVVVVVVGVGGSVVSWW